MIGDDKDKFPYNESPEVKATSPLTMLSLGSSAGMPVFRLVLLHTEHTFFFSFGNFNSPLTELH